MIGLGFSSLFNTCMQKADLGHHLEHRLALDSEKETQDAMRTWVLRSHIDGHRIVAHPIADLCFCQFAFLYNIVVLYLLLHALPLFLLLVTLHIGRLRLIGRQGSARLLSWIDLTAALIEFTALRS